MGFIGVWGLFGVSKFISIIFMTIPLDVQQVVIPAGTWKKWFTVGTQIVGGKVKYQCNECLKWYMPTDSKVAASKPAKSSRLYEHMRKFHSQKVRDLVVPAPDSFFFTTQPINKVQWPGVLKKPGVAICPTNIAHLEGVLKHLVGCNIALSAVDNPNFWEMHTVLFYEFRKVCRQTISTTVLEGD